MEGLLNPRARLLESVGDDVTRRAANNAARVEEGILYVEVCEPCRLVDDLRSDGLCPS